MASLFDTKINQFLFNNFRNYANNENKLSKTIRKANDLYLELINKYGNVSNMSDDEVNVVKIQVQQFKAVKNRISNVVNNIIKQISNINDIIKLILSIIKISRIIIKILKLLPIPAQFLTSGAIVTFSDKLQKADRKIEALEAILKTVQIYINIILQLLKKVQSLLTTLDQIIALIEAFLAARNQKFLEETKANPTIQQTINIPNSNVIGFYNGFTFELRQEENINYQVGDIKRNYAVAIDSNGIDRIHSQFSFASDPQVLIDELRFMIDRDNLKA